MILLRTYLRTALLAADASRIICCSGPIPHSPPQSLQPCCLRPGTRGVPLDASLSLLPYHPKVLSNAPFRSIFTLARRNELDRVRRLAYKKHRQPRGRRQRATPTLTPNTYTGPLRPRKRRHYHCIEPGFRLTPKSRAILPLLYTYCDALPL